MTNVPWTRRQPVSDSIIPWTRRRGWDGDSFAFDDCFDIQRTGGRQWELRWVDGGGAVELTQTVDRLWKAVCFAELAWLYGDWPLGRSR